MSKRTCYLATCDRAHYARSYCKAHYSRVTETGDPQEWRPIESKPSASERDNIAARIMSRSTPNEDGCIEWQGAASANGYGNISWQGRPWLVHRAIWTATVGPIPTDDDWTIDHLCRNRACVNVQHMEVVTRIENAERGGGIYVAIEKRRNITHCVHGHEFTAENTIRLKGQGDSTSRLCRACNNRRWAAKSHAINAKRRAQRAAEVVV
jgi:hypothetical protein